MHRPTGCRQGGVVPDPPAALAPRGCLPRRHPAVLGRCALFRHVGRRAAAARDRARLHPRPAPGLAPRPVSRSVVVGRPAYLRRPRCFLVIAQPKEGAACPPSACGWWWSSTRAAVVGILLAFASGVPARQAASYGAATGLVWSVDAAFVKATTESAGAQGWLALLVHWPLYGAVITGRAGHVPPAGVTPRRALGRVPVRRAHRRPPAQHRARIEVFGEQLNNSAPAITGQSAQPRDDGPRGMLISKWAPPSMEPLRRR